MVRTTSITRRNQGSAIRISPPILRWGKPTWSFRCRTAATTSSARRHMLRFPSDCPVGWTKRTGRRGLVARRALRAEELPPGAPRSRPDVDRRRLGAAGPVIAPSQCDEAGVRAEEPAHATFDTGLSRPSKLAGMDGNRTQPGRLKSAPQTVLKRSLVTGPVAAWANCPTRQASCHVAPLAVVGCHWPSRRKSVTESELARTTADDRRRF